MSLPFRIYPVRKDEVLRRSAMRNPSAEEMRLLDECCRDGGYVLEYHITERPRALEIVKDEALREALSGCEAVIVFTASLGDAFRDLVESHDEPEKDILYQGLAAERMDALIESYLDYKENILKTSGAVLTSHYPFSWNGVEENSCTATRIVGIGMHPEQVRQSRCRTCFVADCPSRRESPQESKT